MDIGITQISALITGMFAVPLLLIVLDFIFFVFKKEKLWFECIAFLLGSIFMAVAYLLWGLPEYDKPLHINDSIRMHEPFSSYYLWAIFLFAFWGFFSYILLKYGRRILSPVVEVFLLAGVYVGIALSAACLVQLSGPKLEGTLLSPFDLTVMGSLSIVPIIYILHSTHLLYRIVQEKAEKQAGKQYDGKLLGGLNSFLLKGGNLFWMAGIALLPLLGIVVMILVLFGQQPDGIILAFTKTSDWMLSQEISPPAVEVDVHYLCTVSLRGHRKLVKPVRYGIRRGEKIVVNRQLCIANAFEQLIQERTPGLHRGIRNLYDKYGYPISKHINSAWSADMVYLIMKPLEWFFLLVLYICDTKPEDRINTQYLPGAPAVNK